jgi:hypothetical protein
VKGWDGVEWLLEIAKEYGLFVCLVSYVLYDSRQREGRYIIREEKYIKIIESIKGVKKDIEDIKVHLFK